MKLKLKGLFAISIAIAAMMIVFACTPPVDDANGNGGGTADTTAPTVVIVSPSSNINIDSNSYTVNGTASDSGVLKAVYIKVNNEAFASLGASTSWSSNCSLVEGPNTILVYAEDKAGNISTTNSVVITVNTGAPMISFTSPDNNFITNGLPIIVSGVADTTNALTYINITNIEVSVNGGVYSSITNGGSNYVEWSTNISTLTNGTNSIAVRAYSDNGKGGTDNYLYVIYDTNSPILTSITPTNNQTNICYTYPPNYTLQGIVSDDLAGVSKVYVKFDTNSFVEVPVNSGSWSTNYSVMSYGQHSNFIYAVDNVSNISETNTINIVLISKKIIASDGAAEDRFGGSAAISDDGNSWIVGAYGDDTYEGSAYWFHTQDAGTNWTTKKITASDGVVNDNFGNSVAMSDDGNTVIIGAYGDDSAKGSAYWLRTFNNGINWTEHKITDSDGVANDYFGNSVAMSSDGNTVIVGAYGADSLKGSAYWLRTTNNGTNWETNEIIASDGVASDFFGCSVAMSDDGNTVIIGAYGDNEPTDDEGSAYWLRTFDNGITWTTNKLTASDENTDDRFGYSVSMSADGNTVIVGAYWDDDNGTMSGSAYWLRTADDSGTNWTTNKIIAYDGTGSDYFGYYVSMSDDGNTVIIGAYGDVTSKGSVYRLRTLDGGTNWTTNKLTAYDSAIGDRFGYRVAISGNGNSWIVGALYDDIGANDHQGSVYWWGE